MLLGFAGAAHQHERLLQAAADFRPGDDDGAAAIAHHTAIEPVQRRGDDRRSEHIVQRDRLAQHRLRAVLRMQRSRHLDRRQLGRRGAELVRMALRHHGLEILRLRAIGQLEGELGIAHCASDIDAVMLAGYGFPAAQGGPMFMADRLGLAAVAAAVERLHAVHGAWWAPAPLLLRRAREGARLLAPPAAA
jgi:hypothetical protein